MPTIFDVDDRPIELGPGRGDLRYSSTNIGPVRTGSGVVRRVGKTPISYANLFATQPYIAAAVMRMLTWSVRVPLKAYRREDNGETRRRLEADEHPLARIIRRPWLGQNAMPAALTQALLGPLLVHGNSLLEIEVIGGEEYVRQLDWRDVTPIGTTDGGDLKGWRHKLPDGQRDVGLDRTIHSKWWSPLGPLGVSPLEMLGTTVAVEDAAQRYQSAMFGNSARPPSAIEASSEFIQLEKGERQALMAQLRADVSELYAGPENAGIPAVLPPGLKWNMVGHSAEEAQLVEQRRVAREEICAVYQIPPPMLGILDKTTGFASLDAQKEMAYTMALGPYLVIIEQTLTATLARDYFGDADIFLEFDFGPVLRGDRSKEIEMLRQAIQGSLMTMNEGRRALNLEPYDEPDADRLFYSANNMEPVGDAVENPPRVNGKRVAAGDTGTEDADEDQ